ncbi:MAG: hypothetical protein ACHQ51_03175, partial [Elusimicrobiota bacterium]
FRAAAARPAPSFGAAGGLALAAGAASLAVNLAHGIVQSPDLLRRFPPLMMAAVAVAALGLYLSVLLLLAVMLYGLGNALGGKGAFDRGLQAAAMLSVLGPIQMLCNWFPFAWTIPAALAAWTAACALEGLFGSAPAPTRALCAVMGAAALGLQFAGRAVADRAREAYAATQVLSQAAGGDAELAKQMQALQQQAAAAAAAMPADPASASAPAPAAPTSGLDLLKGPDDDARGPSSAPEPTAQQAALQQAQGVQTHASGMLDALAPMLNNPALTKSMTPQQKAAMKELQSIIADTKGQLDAGRGVSDPAFAAKMQRIQQLTMQMMSAGLQTPAGAAPPAPAAPAQRHLKLPGDEK